MQQWNLHGLNFSLLCQLLLNYINTWVGKTMIIQSLSFLENFFLIHKIFVLQIPQESWLRYSCSSIISKQM